MVLMASNVTGMTRRCHLRCFLRGTVEGRHHDLGCFFLQWNNGAPGCAGASNSSWLCGDVQRASLMTEGPRLCGNDWVFQQDNAPIHNARLTKTFFQENNITLLDHPACSPDLNPIENIWGWMAREVYKNGLQFQTVDALREAIFTTWRNIRTSLLETLASSMPKRFFDDSNKMWSIILSRF
ncbi:unnamed protein product [Pleuronectes platessa]|uniref:Tc1-like transposase DDE domain-containing protein n=1 Tax=Pleuronectes platessa TaxID=8262 RepID=A0A9N7U631_PLEPL|nr:unnamed protein product [Pleuronectes platessa]